MKFQEMFDQAIHHALINQSKVICSKKKSIQGHDELRPECHSSDGEWSMDP